MDIRNGDLYTAEEAAKIMADPNDERREFLRQVDGDVKEQFPLEQLLRRVKVHVPQKRASGAKKIKRNKIAKMTRKKNRGK
jgi:hypothetical protein